jgi:hypothetical protein
MAILAEGRIVETGTPADLILRLRGRVWARAADKAELPALRERFDVIATRLRAGRTVVHVVSDGPPEEGFTESPAGLEDVYFSTLHEQRRAAAAAAK